MSELQSTTRVLVSLSNRDRLYLNEAAAAILETARSPYVVVDYGPPQPCTCCAHPRQSRAVIVYPGNLVSRQVVRGLWYETSGEGPANPQRAAEDPDGENASPENP